MNMKKVIKEISSYALVILVVFLIKQYVVSPIRVNGESMYGTLHDQDIMILNKTIYHFKDIKRFDIVVVKTNQEPIIKRVIGLPSEKIEYKDSVLYVNGKKIQETFDHAKTEDFSTEDLDNLIIPDDMYLVLGDNRVNSLDSRVLGLIPKKDILGQAKYVILPFSRFGEKK